MSDQAKAKVVVLGTDHPHVYALAQTVQKSPQMELVGVYNQREDLRKDASEKLGVPAYDTPEAALASKPALALVGAVPCDRAQLAVKAIEAGANVLVDKPLALTEADLDAVRQATEKHNRQTAVYYPYRGHPLVAAAKKAVESGRIGKLVRAFSSGPHKLNAPSRPDWHWTKAGTGGALIDIGSHHVDTCCWFAGQAPNWVSAIHGNLSQPSHPEFQDFAQAQLRFPNGTFGHVEVDWLNPVSMKHFGDTRMWFQGTEGKIELRLGDEITGFIWTNDVAAEPLQPVEESHEGWDQKLMEDLAFDRPCIYPQQEIWTTSLVTLKAFESAENNGQPISL